MKTPRLAIVEGVRTPFCKLGGQLASLSADELGRIAVNALLTKTGLAPGMVDEVIFGCVSQPAEAMNVARVIALRSGIPNDVPAMTVHRNCASGMESLTTARERMAAGRGEIFIVGGTESMSQAPLLFQLAAASKFTILNKARTTGAKLKALSAFRPADFAPRIGLQLGLTDPVSGLNMGETAEILAREHGITREEQDQFALRSHQLATEGRDRLAEEITPVYIRGKAITTDDGIRESAAMARLAKLKPVFDRNTGTVTAGNASQITDGAVALLVMSERRAAELGYTPLGYLSGYAYTGCDPERMGLGPVSAIRAVNQVTGLSLEDASVLEINEAFAAQILAVLIQLGAVELANHGTPFNPNGGSIALGHPVGATGTRLILTSLKELHRRRARRALVSLCVGGGQGAALWLERNLS